METRAHHILIGLFTLIVVGAALAFALWLGKAGHDKQFNHYDVVFEEAVAGLSKGSTVEFNGIKIGEVNDLRLDPRDPRRVLARIRVDSKAPIRTDTRARLTPAGITGLYTIRLSSGDDPASQPLRPAGGEVPVIVAEPSPLSKLLADGGDVMLNVNELLIQARTLFSSENAAAIGRTLQHLEQTTGTLAAQREDMGHTLRQLALASEQANLALAEAAKMMQATNRLIDGEGRQTLESAQRAMAAFEQAAQSVDKLLVDNRDPLDSGLRGLADLGPAITELRQTLASLRTITRQLESRPADYLLGLEPTKEFQP
ncbi:MCE family protein [Pseudothauera nasutitermitis]|uniref:MCE family protein n=1 Tax=Pseudothauera nasutitermitis TaxID=2565930 RepID=A0A4S4AYN7_9RHOO|nr:MlaD family protein [Pseudothauera nasutitermitis]THF63752.1 MCE family protein [Pseudothauera nasutitermitis]